MTSQLDPSGIPRSETKYQYLSPGKKNDKSKKSRENFAEELNQYGLSEDIVNRALIIFSKMKDKIHRNKRRIQLRFFCVYNAYKELGIEVEPFTLGRKFGIKPGDVRKSDSIFSESQTGYQQVEYTTTPINFLPDAARTIGLSEESIKELIIDSQRILDKESTLYQDTPQTVTAGLLQYFLNNNGIRLEDPDLMIKAVNRSSVTTDNMCKRIAEIDNN